MAYVDVVADFFAANNIELFSVIPFDSVKVINQRKFERRRVGEPRSIIIMAVPYFTGKEEGANISLYARSYDYHLFFKELFASAEQYFGGVFDGFCFEGYADSGYIDERYAAVIGGLGVFGENGTVITKEYGSFVFLGEIITDADCSMFYKNQASPSDFEIKSCIHCGKCKQSCPMYRGECNDCLSMITQKKGELDNSEAALMVKYLTAWGCDICQTVCPMNKNVKLTPIQFFYKNRISAVTPETVVNIDDTEFEKRAFSWRGRKTILRNAEILQKAIIDGEKGR